MSTPTVPDAGFGVPLMTMQDAPAALSLAQRPCPEKEVCLRLGAELAQKQVVGAALDFRARR